MANILIKQGLEIAVPDFVITTDEARKVDLTDIIQTGTTSSQAISAGAYFYLNNVLVRAKVDIANGATFTLNTNYEVVTAGALNELKDAIDDRAYSKLDFKGITASNPKSFVTNVCIDLVGKFDSANQAKFIGYVWGGTDIYVGYAVRRDTGHIYGILTSASASFATYNFDYTISNGSIRVASIQGTQL